MFKKTILASSLLFIFGLKSSAQHLQTFNVEFVSGYNNTTISKGMNGFYFQSSLGKQITPYLSARLTLGMAKSSNFPQKFDQDCIAFTASDTLLGNFKYNQDLWKLVKDLNPITVVTFDLTSATNIYLGANADVKIVKIQKMTFSGTVGVNFCNTFGSTLYLKDSYYSNNKLIKYVPVSTYNTDNVIGYNVGFRIQYDIARHASILFTAEKYFGDNGSGRFAKSDWLNIGVGIVKQF
jgi:hypothetical protein